MILLLFDLLNEFFQEFSLIIENIFRNSERRVDVDKWYTRLVRVMFDVIPRVALENSKIPADVVKMGKSLFDYSKVFIIQQRSKFVSK